MKKIIALLLIISALLISFSSCDDDKNIYEIIEYRENGIEFSLPNYMRRSVVEGYDFYFTNLSIVYTAVKLDSEFLESKNLAPGISGKEYIDVYVERNGLDLERMSYTYEDDRILHNFRYTFGDETSGMEMFYYVVVVGEQGNLWYIEMCCKYEDSATCLSSFEVWKKYIKTYKE